MPDVIASAAATETDDPAVFLSNTRLVFNSRWPHSSLTAELALKSARKSLCDMVLVIK